MLNVPFVYLRINEVLPTPCDPNKTTLASSPSVPSRLDGVASPELNVASGGAVIVRAKLGESGNGELLKAENRCRPSALLDSVILADVG